MSNVKVTKNCMKLTDEQFKKVCKKLSRDIFKYMKRKISSELNILSKGNPKLIDVNTTVNVIITSLGILDGNMINICRKVYKGINSEEIDIKKLLTLHQHIINQMLEVHSCKEILN